MDTNSKKPEKTILTSKVWWLVMLILVIWNIWIFLPQAQAEVNIPYSFFLDQVRTGNIASVNISDYLITGKFVKSILWPQPNSNSEPSPAATPDSLPTTTASSQPAAAASASYSEFRTTFPETVGDPNLISLLETHGVEIDVTTPASPLFTAIL
ncbi:MAG: ATP-dependent metallopeptidase FtsH/Yme1/Tma family protein, partial [Anaerolineales bacterium]|nr:ATP-dependent metallopeptidase FtsH/Yme1/Tma family protein [Anaerolineales bacterium]